MPQWGPSYEYNICFCGEIRKILHGYRLLSTAMVWNSVISLWSYWTPGLGCSKITMSVNDSLKFISSDTQICWNCFWKHVSSFCSAKATHIFSAKNIRLLYIESTKTVNEMTLNELVKLTTLWTTGPRYIVIDTFPFCQFKKGSC